MVSTKHYVIRGSVSTNHPHVYALTIIMRLVISESDDVVLGEIKTGESCYSVEIKTTLTTNTFRGVISLYNL